MVYCEFNSAPVTRDTYDIRYIDILCYESIWVNFQ